MVFGVIIYLHVSQIREWLKSKHRHVTMRIDKIDVSLLNDKFKPLSLDPVEIELEVLHLKRATTTIFASDGSKESKFLAILEFRGSTLILTRSTGEVNANLVVDALETDYLRRYGMGEMLYPVTSLEKGRIVHSTVDDPQKFFEYLHLLKNLSTVQVRNIPTRRSKTLRKFTSTE